MVWHAKPKKEMSILWHANPPPPQKKCNMPLGLEDRRTSSKKSIVSQGGFKSKISNCTFKDYDLQNNFDITGQNK